MAIERKFINQNLKEFRIKEFVSGELSRVGLSSIRLQRTPLGDKIIINASRPGLVVGRAGSNIQKLTTALKEEFNLENPQIEIEEVEEIGLDAAIIAEMIVNSMERFGSRRFKGVGHRALQDVMAAGALGVEILISGKVPSQRSRTWRFYQGYLKKCGDIAITGVNIAYKKAVLKSGVVGVKVSIMPPTTKLPDEILIQEPDSPTVEEVGGGEAVALENELSEVASGEVSETTGDSEPKSNLSNGSKNSGKKKSERAKPPQSPKLSKPQNSSKSNKEIKVKKEEGAGKKPLSSSEKERKSSKEKANANPKEVQKEDSEVKKKAKREGSKEEQESRTASTDIEKPNVEVKKSPPKNEKEGAEKSEE